MNIRKTIDYSTMLAALDMLVAEGLPQIELCYEIGRVISSQQGKGAAVAAAEHLQSVFPGMSGFSPRNLRRMREFFRAYENAPEVLNEAMTIGWTQTMVILESDFTLQERAWYIHAVQQSGWSKAELRKEIEDNVHLEENPDLANYRRDGYDFDARYEEGLASYREKCVMDVLLREGPMLSKDLKRLAGFGGDGP